MDPTSRWSTSEKVVTLEILRGAAPRLFGNKIRTRALFLLDIASLKLPIIFVQPR